MIGVKSDVKILCVQSEVSSCHHFGLIHPNINIILNAYFCVENSSKRDCGLWSNLQVMVQHEHSGQGDSFVLPPLFLFCLSFPSCRLRLQTSSSPPTVQTFPPMSSDGPGLTWSPCSSPHPEPKWVAGPMQAKKKNISLDLVRYSGHMHTWILSGAYGPIL